MAMYAFLVLMSPGFLSKLNSHSFCG